MGQVISLSSDIDSTVASKFKQVGVVRSCSAVERCVPLPLTMEEILFGPLWYMISPLLTTDDVVMLRTVARRWTVGNKYGALGETSLMLILEEYEKTGNMMRMAKCVFSMLRKRNPIMGFIRKRGLHPLPEETPPDEQGMVDMTSFTVLALSGSWAAEAQLYQAHNAWAYNGQHDDRASKTSGSLSPDVEKCGSMGAQKSADWDSGEEGNRKRGAR